MTDIVPNGEIRKYYYFEGVEYEQQEEVMNTLKIEANNYIIIHRLEKNLDFGEFKKVVSLIGKPKHFYCIARYSEFMQRQAIIGFDNPQDKRYFMNVFRLIFPDYIVQEMSKIIKVFCMTYDQSPDTELDWKDFFVRKFKAETVFVSTGAEVLAADYRLSKHPLFQPYMPLKTVVVEFSSAGYAFEALLQMSESSIQHPNCFNLLLFGMFEADEEQKAFVIEKKEMQKIEDDAEKCVKHIDNYLMKQMAMQMSPDQIKEQGLDKADTQTKSNTYFRNLGESLKHHRIKETVKQMEETQKSLHVQIDPQTMPITVDCLEYYKTAIKSCGQFNRYNEPILFTTVEDMLRHWDYDHFKYNAKRDPNIEEVVAAAQAYHPQMGKEMNEVADYCTKNKEAVTEKICCVTHAATVHFFSKDAKNICREINKFTVGAYMKELNDNLIDPKVDPSLVFSDQNRNKLQSIMPLINSLYLWGRYKQKQAETEQLLHVAPDLGQKYEQNVVYKNVNWVWGLPEGADPFKMGGQALYIVTIPSQFYNSAFRLPKGLKCLPPFQLMQYVGEELAHYPEENPLRTFRVIRFQIVQDYNSQITWKRKEVIKGKQ